MFRPFTTVKVVSYNCQQQPHHTVLVENVLTNIANSIYPDQTDRIVSVGSVSMLIESVLSTEWQCLKINWHVH